MAPVYIDNSSTVRLDNVTNLVGEGVSTKSLAWSRQHARKLLTRDLRGGSDAMRATGALWLPMEQGEKLPGYRARLKRSHLLGAYGDAVEKLVSKPFSREITFADEDRLPDRLSAMHDDIAANGTDQTSFWRDVFETALDDGIAFMLVEFPETGGEQSRGHEVKAQIHPYLVPISPHQFIGPRFRRRADNNREELRQIRILTTELEERAEYGEEEVDYIRVYTAPADISTATPDELAEYDPEELKGTFEVWRRDPKKDEWELFREPTTYSYPGIPLAALPFRAVGPYEGRPCLWKLAEANLEHWQKKSDRDNLMHVAHVPILNRFGYTAQELKKPITVGGGRSMGSTQKDARMEYVDTRPAAAALSISKEDIEHLEEQMERLGLEPLVRRAASSLATNMAIGDAKETNLLQAWALLTEAFIKACYKVAGIWVGEEVPDTFSADLYSEYGLSNRATENVKALDAARARGDISHQTYLEELKRYGVVAEGIDVDVEMKRVDDEKEAEPTGMDDDDEIEDNDLDDDDEGNDDDKAIEDDE